jgi:hypothetical protein
VVSSTPPSETAPAAAPEVAPALALSEEAPTTNVSVAAVSEPAISPPEPEPTAAVPPQVAAADLQLPSSTPKEKATPNFRLYGIIYSTVRPCAIVNGETVCVGDRVSGATVTAIGRNNVTLQINGQPKTYLLR